MSITLIQVDEFFVDLVACEEGERGGGGGEGKHN